MSLQLRDLVDVPESPEDRCHVAELFLAEWRPDLAPTEVPTTQGLPTDVPLALAWAQTRFGPSGAELFLQDPLIAYETVRGETGDVVPFRREQQGCAEWGYRADGDADPAVLMRDPTDPAATWQPYQSTLSMHLLEGVLSETSLAGTFAANAEASDAALEALERLPLLGIPRHPFWGGAGTVSWHGIDGAVVRNDADTWLWAVARSSEELETLVSTVPGDWFR